MYNSSGPTLYSGKHTFNDGRFAKQMKLDSLVLDQQDEGTEWGLLDPSLVRLEGKHSHTST